MKAIVIREFGPPNVMKLEEVPTPEPGPGEVLIKVHAVSVNRTLDTRVRAGTYARPVTLPLVPGVDPSGVVAKVGRGRHGSQGRRPRHRCVAHRATCSGADAIRLLGVHAWGGYAEYVQRDRRQHHDHSGRTSISRPRRWSTRHAPTGVSPAAGSRQGAAGRMGAGDGRGGRARQRRRAGRQVSRRQGDRRRRQRRPRQGRVSISAPTPA